LHQRWCWGHRAAAHHAHVHERVREGGVCAGCDHGRGAAFRGGGGPGAPGVPQQGGGLRHGPLGAGGGAAGAVPHRVPPGAGACRRPAEAGHDAGRLVQRERGHRQGCGGGLRQVLPGCDHRPHREPGQLHRPSHGGALQEERRGHTAARELESSRAREGQRALEVEPLGQSRLQELYPWRVRTGPRQQVCGGDHREEPQRHRGAGDRRPRGSDHHARVLPGRGEHDLREG
ncbi:unnamed protein product, partial [Effrenium voratum]